MVRFNDVKRRLIACASVAVLVIALSIVYLATRPKVQIGEKTITVTVVHKDALDKTFTYETDAEYLDEVLLAEGLIVGEEGPYGLYITAVDGEKAEQSYWAIYEGEEYAPVGVSELIVEDGDRFTLVYTIE